MARTRPPKTPAENLRNNLKALYGLTPADYEAMRQSQGARCAICDRHEDEMTDRPAGRPRRDGQPSAVRRLGVDHDHETGRIRGLLCRGCNMALGHFGDDPARLLRAIAYLERS